MASALLLRLLCLRAGPVPEGVPAPGEVPPVLGRVCLLCVLGEVSAVPGSVSVTIEGRAASCAS